MVISECLEPSVHPSGNADTTRPELPRIQGLYETHLTVANLERSIAFYWMLSV